MDEELTTESIIIHFQLDNNEHKISIEQSITTEQSVKAIVHNIGNILFGNNQNIKITVSVLPAETGSLKKKFLVGIIGPIFTAVVSDIINGVIVGLGDGRTIQEYVADGTKGVIEYISTATTNFISEKNQDLYNKGINYNDFAEAYEAKHKLYYTSLLDQRTLGISFSDDLVGIIPKNEFAYRLNDTITDRDGIDPEEKFHNLIVVAPIVSKKDRKLTRRVKDILDRDEEKKSFDVYMQDNEFYNSFLENPFVIETLLVKMRYDLRRDENGNIKVDKKKITKVYKFNNTQICELPANAVITPAPRSPEPDLEEVRNNTQIQQPLFETL